MEDTAHGDAGQEDGKKNGGETSLLATNDDEILQLKLG